MPPTRSGRFAACSSTEVSSTSALKRAVRRPKSMTDKGAFFAYAQRIVRLKGVSLAEFREVEISHPRDDTALRFG